jgi:amino acid adenylation domain-containing protein
MNDPVSQFGSTVTIPRLERTHSLLPSLSQQRLWFASQVGGSGLEFIFPYALRLRGELNREALKTAINTIVRRHEVLRTNFVAHDGEPLQVVRDDFTFDLNIERIEGLDQSAREVALAAALKLAVETPFALEADLMLRAHLFQLEQQEHVLLLVVHHIATDGWSMDVLFKELGLVYDAVCAGVEPQLPILPVQFTDYAAWERRRIAENEFEEEMRFWRDHLDGAEQTLDLPLDHPRPAVQTFSGSWVKFSLPPETVSLIDAVAAARRATRFQVLLAGYQTVLARWQSRNDIIIGTPAANRLLPETEVLIGFFMNLLPLRGQIDETESFSTLVDRTREVVISGFDNQALSFDRLVAELSPERTLAQNPMLQTTLAMESNLPVSLRGLQVEVIEARPNVARYDVAFDYWPDPDNAGGLCFDAYYATDIFERRSIEDLIERFKSFMHAACLSPELPLARVPTTAPAELARIVACGCGATPPSSFVPIQRRFREHVQNKSGDVAVSCNGVRLTYGEIANIANLVASKLDNVVPDDLVAVYLPRCAEWVAVVLGILDAGAAYLPLDPSYPKDRLDFMLKDSGAKTIITTTDLAPHLPVADGVRLLVMPQNVTEIASISSAQVNVHAAVIRPEQLAYLIYTSGSTGQPKGCAVTHRSLSAFLTGLEQDEAIRPGRARVGCNASQSFDASVQQWVRVCRGDSLVIVPDDVRRDPGRLAALCAREQITDLDLTPSQVEVMIEGLSSIPATTTPLRLWIGGESISHRLWDDLAGLPSEKVEAINVYGVTETTVDTTWARLEHGVAPHLGQALPGNKVFVLDALLRAVPLGVEGELCIAGPSLARGYLHQPGLTAKRFVPNPFAQPGDADTRLYRTGDLVRWNSKQQLEFIGRVDDQIKVRGHRIEPKEIEAKLCELPGVAECAVVRRDDERGVALWAFVRGNAALHVLREHAEATLPAWMCPSGYTFVDAMPKTPSGKLDRQALVKWQAAPERGHSVAGAAFEMRPMNSVEKAVSAIWSEILAVPAVRREDNFFHLGGHSLLAIKMIARIKKAMQLTLPMTAIFERPLLSEFSAHVERIIREKLAAQQ